MWLFMLITEFIFCHYSFIIYILWDTDPILREIDGSLSLHMQ